MQRLFIAVEIPADIRSSMENVVNELKAVGADVRWEAREKFHVTLKFLGKTEERLVPQIVAALEEIARHREAFTVRYASLGKFPPQGQPRIIWVGVHEGEEPLKALAAEVDESMSALGFEREERPFHPHVTIGRVKGRHHVGDLLRRMESITFESQPTLVAHISLVRSELKPSGSVYTTLKALSFHAGRTN